MRKTIFVITLLSVSQLSFAFTFTPAYTGKQPTPAEWIIAPNADRQSNASPVRTILSVFFNALPLLFVGESAEEKEKNRYSMAVDQIEDTIEAKRKFVVGDLAKKAVGLRTGEISEKAYSLLIRQVQLCDERLGLGFQRCDELYRYSNIRNFYACYSRRKSNWDSCVDRIPL